jgi:hypothetical protein
MEQNSQGSALDYPFVYPEMRLAGSFIARLAARGMLAFVATDGYWWTRTGGLDPSKTNQFDNSLTRVEVEYSPSDLKKGSFRPLIVTSTSICNDRVTSAHKPV